MNNQEVEEQIENLLMYGKTNVEISNILTLDEEKVKTAVRNIYDKHQVNNRLQLAIKLFKQNS